MLIGTPLVAKTSRTDHLLEVVIYVTVSLYSGRFFRSAKIRLASVVFWALLEKCFLTMCGKVIISVLCKMMTLMLD